jgi:hypothetical protein
MGHIVIRGERNQARHAKNKNTANNNGLNIKPFKDKAIKQSADFV